MTDHTDCYPGRVSHRSSNADIEHPPRCRHPVAHDCPAEDRVRQFLKNNTFLGSLSESALAALVRRGHIKRYAAGDVLYRRHERGDTLMVIISGWVKITTSNIDGKEVVLNFLGTGDTNGEMAMLDGEVRSADAIALKDTEVFLAYGRDLLPMLTAHPQALLEIIQILCEKLRAASAMIEDNTLDMRRRAARGLLRLAMQHGRTRNGGICVDPTLSQRELAGYLGLSRENVNRQLGHLKAANVIRSNGAQIIVTDELALHQIAEVGASEH
jgi:CRP/FNR family transcriptional regulator, cyclic AMP receptor protein